MFTLQSEYSVKIHSVSVDGVNFLGYNNAIMVDGGTPMNYENNAFFDETLTFQEAEQAFQKYGVEFSREKFRTLGMIQKKDELYTNLALILSDQCTHTTKVAVFGDEENTTFKDHKEFGGSVFRQLENTYGYLALCNKTAVVFKGLERIEKPDYPEEALREALLNALVHRDYSFSGSIIINVNDRRMEFISIGGLLPGLSPEDIRMGISQPRNKNLAEVFHRLRLIESYGTGIRRIFRLYEGCPIQPSIEVTANAFKLTLPNQNAAVQQSEAVTEQMKKVLDYLKEKGRITDAELGEFLGLKKTRTYSIAKEMRELGLIEANGKGSGRFYTLR